MRSTTRRLGLKAPETTPHAGELRLGNVTYEILFWTPAQWQGMAERDRPPDAARLSDGAWFAIRPKRISSSASS